MPKLKVTHKVTHNLQLQDSQNHPESPNQIPRIWISPIFSPYFRSPPDAKPPPMAPCRWTGSPLCSSSPAANLAGLQPLGGSQRSCLSFIAIVPGYIKGISPSIRGTFKGCWPKKGMILQSSFPGASPALKLELQLVEVSGVFLPWRWHSEFHQLHVANESFTDGLMK